MFFRTLDQYNSMKTTPILILLILFLNGCKQRSYDVPVKAEVNNINNYLHAVVDRQQIPGLTLAATRNDTVVYFGEFGFRNI